MFEFVIMALTTEVRAVTKEFAGKAYADEYGHELNRQLKPLGLRAKWGPYNKGFAVPDNTKHVVY